MSQIHTNEPPPEWAVLYVRGAVRIGMRVQEIERHLVSKGLTADVANRMIMEVIEANTQESSPPVDSGARATLIRLFICTIIGAACLFLAHSNGGNRSLGLALIWVAPALLSIWIPELTEVSDSDWRARTWFAGWFLLLLYLGYRIFIAVMWP